VQRKLTPIERNATANQLLQRRVHLREQARFVAPRFCNPALTGSFTSA
jgi:hypothetical protein